MGDRRASYEIHRLGGDLAEGLRSALSAYRQRHGGAPASVVVTAENTAKARAVLDAVGLPTIPVSTTGGCLAWECWLEVGAPVNGKPSDLLRRAVAAHVELTPAEARQLALALEEVTR